MCLVGTTNMPEQNGIKAVTEQKPKLSKIYPTSTCQTWTINNLVWDKIQKKYMLEGTAYFSPANSRNTTLA